MTGSSRHRLVRIDRPTLPVEQEARLHDAPMVVRRADLARAELDLVIVNDHDG